MPAQTKKTVAPKQETAPVAPVVEKKAAAKKTATAEVATPQPPAPVAQKGGKAKVVAPVVAAPVVAAPVAAKAVKAKATPAATTPAPAKEVAPKQKAGAKKAAVAAAEKPAKQPKTPKAAKKVVEEADEEADGEKGVRSFKVQLPGNEEFTGRFTGLTPYQAANKALSKYFRENKAAKTEITFSIRESTRGSKRSTYTYNGKREKLSTPVKYTIKGTDGENREIVKEFKNKLTKVKKAETKAASA